MATATQALVVPLEEYLRTTYHPDCEWLDGEVRERNMGERPHAGMQRLFLKFFFALEDQFGYMAYPELRTQVSRTHFRIPDVLVLRRDDPYNVIVTVPPLLCIEILSPDDRMSEMHEKIEDYLEMGVGEVWVVDPLRRKAWVANHSGFQSTGVFQVPGTEVALTVEELFAEFDKLEGRQP